MENFKMNFYENLRKTFDDLDFGSRGRQTGRVSSGHPKNGIIDFFQYAQDNEDENKYITKQSEHKPMYYTPFSWSDGTNNIKGYVVSGTTGEGQRILGLELEDGRSFNSTGAKKFFNTMKEKGAFDFAKEGNLWSNKEDGDWPFQPGNPFDFYTKDGGSYSTVDNSGAGTFRVDAPRSNKAEEGKNRLRDAMDFFKNLRKSRGEE